MALDVDVEELRSASWGLFGCSCFCIGPTCPVEEGHGPHQKPVVRARAEPASRSGSIQLPADISLACRAWSRSGAALLHPGPLRNAHSFALLEFQLKHLMPRF